MQGGRILQQGSNEGRLDYSPSLASASRSPATTVLRYSFSPSSSGLPGGASETRGPGRSTRDGGGGGGGDDGGGGGSGGSCGGVGGRMGSPRGGSKKGVSDPSKRKARGTGSAAARPGEDARLRFDQLRKLPANRYDLMELGFGYVTPACLVPGTSSIWYDTRHDMLCIALVPAGE